MINKKGLILLLCICIGWTLNPIKAQGVQSSENRNFEILKNLEIFGSAYKEIETIYVDPVESGHLIKKALDAMLESLDPYTVYIPEANIEDYKIMTLGQYGGIGSTIRFRDGFVCIAEPYEGFPADKAGLMPGDKILSINGESTEGRDVSQVSALLKGQAGTTLNLSIQRNGLSKPISVSLIRQEIKIDNVTYSGMLKDSVGYIRLDGFTQNAAEEIKKAFLAIKKSGANKLILDLRYNGGGLLNEAVKIVNLFYKKGVPVVSTKGRVEEKNSTFYTTENPIDTEIPIVILTSRASASASEIVAGALQDYDRAVILGERTFGKGLVQNILPLPYNSQIKVTVSKYYIPSGRCVQAIDYSHKDEDGRAPKIPDSLRTAFKTAGGRVVYDGDGIEPDIEIPYPFSGYATAAMFTQFHISDYANIYKSKHPEIGSIDNFNVTDSLYNDFLSFMKDRDYSYKLSSELLLDRLKNTAENDSIYPDIKESIELLEKSIEDTKKGDLLKERSSIGSALTEEIVSRYYYQKGRAQAELKNDPWVDRAIDILINSKDYKNILNKQDE